MLECCPVWLFCVSIRHATALSPLFLSHSSHVMVLFKNCPKNPPHRSRLPWFSSSFIVHVTTPQPCRRPCGCGLFFFFFGLTLYKPPVQRGEYVVQGTCSTNVRVVGRHVGTFSHRSPISWSPPSTHQSTPGAIMYRNKYYHYHHILPSAQPFRVLIFCARFARLYNTVVW